MNTENQIVKRWNNLLFRDEGVTTEPQVRKLLEWFKPNWLQRNDDISLQKLWKRRSYQAAVELYCLADALMRCEPLLSDDARAEIKRKLKQTPDQSDGTAFELLLARMFLLGGEAVAFPGASQAGYDLVVHRGPKRIRVSCKHLRSSDHFYTFQRFAEEINTMFATLLTPNEHLNIWAVLDNFDEGELSKGAKNAFKASLQTFRNQSTDFKEISLSSSGWHVFFTRMDAAPGGQPLAEGHPSFIFNAFVSRHSRAQKRVLDKLQKGITGLRDPAFAQDHDVVNLIAMRLPAEISIQELRESMQHFWREEHAHVTGLMVLRNSMVYELDLSSKRMYLERHYFPNPHASHQISEVLQGTPLRMETTFGQSGAKEPKVTMVAGDRISDIPHSFHHSGGKLHFVLKEPGSLSVNRIPNVKTAVVLSLEGGPQGTIRWLPTEERDELLLM